MGGHFKVSLSYEAIEVEESTDRFINTFYVENGADNHKQFAGLDAIYTFQNKDNEAFPAMGMQTSLQVGYKTNIEASRAMAYGTALVLIIIVLISNLLANALRKYYGKKVKMN